MDQPSNINLYDYPSKNMSPPLPNNVSGWLLGVHGYRDSPLHTNDQQENNNTTMIANHMERRKSISSIASEDSVNLDDLIKANFTLDMDDETDLPNLASLDLGDDSKEDFWKMDKELSDYQKPKETYRKDTNFVGSLGKDHHHHLDSPELSWSPPYDDDEHIETLSPLIHTNPTSINRHRSGSINSDNSTNSYTTVTAHQYTRYGMTPMIYQSDSTSTSSRTPSRLSNYSTSSQTSSSTNAALPRPRKVSATSTTGMPSPSRSFTTRDNEQQQQHLLPRAHSRLGTPSKLAKRASHIPAPSSMATSPKSVPRLTSIPSSRSTGAGRSSSRPTAATLAPSSGSRKLATRASHIPSIYERSGSPAGGRTTATTTTSPIRNSVFGLRREEEAPCRQNSTTTGLRSIQRRGDGTGKSTAGRTDVRSSSRIGFRKL